MPTINEKKGRYRIGIYLIIPLSSHTQHSTSEPANAARLPESQGPYQSPLQESRAQVDTDLK